MVRLSERETCKLLELYRQNECLWNINHTDYKRQVKQIKLEAIAREMNIENFSALAVRNKLKSLRSTYKLELMKMKRLANEGFQDFRTNLKWFNIMDSIFKMQENCKSSTENQSLENGEQAPEDILLDDSECDLQTGSIVEIPSASVSSAPSESEIEQSIKSISIPESITTTPEIQYVRSLSSSEFYSVIPEVQEVQPVSDSQVVTATPDILADKAVSSPETITVTSGVQQTIKSISDPAVTAVPSGIQTAKSTPAPKIFALVPDIQTSSSASTPRFITVSAGNNQNVRYVSGSPGLTLASEIQQRVKQVSTDGTLLNRKRRHEEVNSTDEVHQINNTRTAIGDFSDRGEDEMDAFGHFVALNLRKMSMQSALSAQSEILSVLTRHRLSNSATNVPSRQTFPCIVTNTPAVSKSSSASKTFLQKLK